MCFKLLNEVYLLVDLRLILNPVFFGLKLGLSCCDCVDLSLMLGEIF